MIDVEVDGAVAVITINNPPVNAMDAAVYREGTAALERCDQDPDVRVAVVTGAGERVFCAGTDVASFSGPESLDDVVRAAWDFFLTLSRRSIPLVGALNGAVVGGGAMIAAECDTLLAVRTAYFRLPELGLGFPGAASHLKRLLPYPVVQRMLLCDERVDAQLAHEVGALEEIVETVADLREAALLRARQIAGLDPRAVRAARLVFRQPEAESALEGYRAELDQLKQILRERSTS